MKEVPVTISPYTAHEAIVSVAPECYENCRKLAGKIATASIHQIDGYYEAIVCDGELPNIAKRFACGATQSQFASERTRQIMPFYIGKPGFRNWIGAIEQGVAERGAKTVTEAYKNTVHKLS